MMNEVRKDSTMANGSIDWEDVERKVQIISRRFATTIDWKYREDMEQELRLFAWQQSSNYYDMYRKAVDYWRHLTRKVFPEVCVFEFEDNNGQGDTVKDEYLESEEFNKMLSKIRKAVDDYQTTKKEKIDHDNCVKILDLIESGIVGEEDLKTTKGKVKISWVSEKLDIPYSRVQDALWLLQQIVTTLDHLNQIDVPPQYHCEYKPF